jgi:hypothetical protein
MRANDDGLDPGAAHAGTQADEFDHTGKRRMVRHRQPLVAPAIGWPRTTSWPTRTMARGTLPMCCDSGTVTRSGKGSRRILRSAVSLQLGGCTPRWKASPRK